jgi:hypothetical protein
MESADMDWIKRLLVGAASSESDIDVYMYDKITHLTIKVDKV